MNITNLRKVTLDKSRLAEKVQSMSNDEIKDLLAVKDSQMFNIRRGEKSPSVDGLLRLMIYHDISPNDLIKTSV